GSEAATRSWALAMRLVATSSMALVIFLVELIDATRRRRVLSCPAMPSLPRGLPRDHPLDGLAPPGLLVDRLGLRLLDLGGLVREERLLEAGDRLVQRLDDLVGPLAVRDRGQHPRVGTPQVLQELGLEPPDVGH